MPSRNPGPSRAPQGRYAAWWRVLGDGEDPTTWALPIFGLRGVRVRIHAVFVLFALVELALSVSLARSSPWFVAQVLIGLLCAVAVHQFVRCAALSRLGVTVAQVTIWPLGGFVATDEPETPGDGVRSRALALLGVAVLAGAAGAVLVTVGGPARSLLFTPLDPASQYGTLTSPVHQWVWAQAYSATIVLAANALLPMFPLDAAWLIHARLVRNNGRIEATARMIVAGFLTAIVLAVVGIVLNVGAMVGLAGVGLVYCWLERRRLTALDDLASLDPPRATRPDSGPSEPDSAILDAVLEKISRFGMDSLTRSERRILKRATDAGKPSAGSEPDSQRSS